MHKTGRIALTSAALLRVRNTLLKHHSKDPVLLRRVSTVIADQMAAEEAYPWVCPCGRLNKKTSNQCALCWGHWSKGSKHDVTPKTKSYGASSHWSSSWDAWDQDWEAWEPDWDDTESVGASSHSSRGRHNQTSGYSPRSRPSKGKKKGKGKGKGKVKGEQTTSPFGAGKGGSASLPAWPTWSNPETVVSPFQSSQSSRNNTMQEMAVHLRQAFRDQEAPADVQAFLEKAEKEYSRNNIKSLQAATKSLDHAQKALRDAVSAKKDHRLQWTKHVGEGIKIWEAQLESYRVHQATLSEHAARARAEIETSRRILKEVSENSVKEGHLSIPQPIQEETEDVGTDNVVDSEEQKLRDQLQGVLNACAGSLGLQVAAAEQQVQEVSDDDKDQAPHHKRQRSVEPAKPGTSALKQ